MFMASCSLDLMPRAALFDRLYLSVTSSGPYSVSLIYFLCDSYEQKRAARGVRCSPAVCCPGVICSRESLASVSFGGISQNTQHYLINESWRDSVGLCFFLVSCFLLVFCFLICIFSFCIFLLHFCVYCIYTLFFFVLRFLFCISF